MKSYYVKSMNGQESPQPNDSVPKKFSSLLGMMNIPNFFTLTKKGWYILTISSSVS